MLYKKDCDKIICSDLKKAMKYFGGNRIIAISLLSRINAIEQATTILDIINQPQFRFHKLLDFGKHKDYEGLFAIDVKTKMEKWRIIIEPLDENDEPFNPCNIDKIANMVKAVLIREVSNHYE